jgi:anti-anti-sigma factor
MAGSVCRRSDGLLGDAEDQAQTAFDKRQHKEDQRTQRTPLTRGEASFARVAVAPVTVARRMHTLILTGSLDRASAHTLETEIERLCEEGVTGITLDLRQLDHIDAIGVAVVAFRCGLCQRRGFDFALIRGSRSIGRAFEQAGVSDLLPFQDEQTAPEQPVFEQPVFEQEQAVGLGPSFDEDQVVLTQVPALALGELQAVAGGEL